MRGGGHKGILLIISRLSKVAWGVLFNLRRFCQLLFRCARQRGQTCSRIHLAAAREQQFIYCTEIPVRDKTHVVKFETKPIIFF